LFPALPPTDVVSRLPLPARGEKAVPNADRALQQFMDAERHAHQEVRDRWHRAHQVAGEDMDLMARVMMGTVHARHQQEAREAAAFHEAAATRAEADALADATTEDAHAGAA
jgi:hypothetical protein